MRMQETWLKVEENVKELFREMFKEQEPVLIIKILSICTDILDQRLDKLTLQITENNNKLKEIYKKVFL